MGVRYIITTVAEYFEVFDTEKKETVFASLDADECWMKKKELDNDSV